MTFACITRANAFLIRKDVLPLFAAILPKISATRTGNGNTYRQPFLGNTSDYETRIRGRNLGRNSFLIRSIYIFPFGGVASHRKNPNVNGKNFLQLNGIAGLTARLFYFTDKKFCPAFPLSLTFGKHARRIPAPFNAH